MSSKRAKGLGRGLSALMAGVDTAAQPREDNASQGLPIELGEKYVPIEKIFPNPEQPRRRFADEDLEDLANSIRAKGVIQPLIVRKRPNGEGEFEIVAGERRWRASQMAQLHELPVIEREFTDTEVLEVAIIENIQRSDLNPVEEAFGYQQLMDKFGHTQEKLAEALGKSRSYIANLLRLLNLPDTVQDYLKEGKLSIGHARALITTDNATSIARQVVEGGLSVRETEKLVKRLAQGSENSDVTPKQRVPSAADKDADTKALEGDLSAAIGMSVSVNHDSKNEKGTVVISYSSLDQLDDICRIINSNN